MKKIDLLSVGIAFISLIFSGVAVCRTCNTWDSGSITVILSFIGVLLAVVGFGNFFIVREANNNFRNEINNIKEEFKNEIEVLKDLNRPPYLDIVIKAYSHDETLDNFKDEMYSKLNNYKGYRILDVHTFMKVNFKLGENLDNIGEFMSELEKKYSNRIDFRYAIIEP